MILILGQAQIDPTTELVQDWIHKLGGDAIRINGDDLFTGRRMATLRLGPTTEQSLDLGDLPIEKIKVVWYRRWLQYSLLRAEIFDRPLGISPEDQHSARNSVVDEAVQFSRSIFDMFTHCKWVPNYRSTSVSKVATLKLAASLGFCIPRTLVTNSKAEIVRFWEEMNRSIITKPLHQIFSYVHNGRAYSHHTVALETTADIDRICGPAVFPSLFQERIGKSYEIRAFYYCGTITAMAMYSQLSPRTSVDFRLVNENNRMHTVPYRLTHQEEVMIHGLMKAMDLSTGSLDLLRGEDGRTIFLEVNPLGQFGMTSVPTGAKLERSVAEHLIALCR